MVTKKRGVSFGEEVEYSDHGFVDIGSEVAC